MPPQGGRKHPHQEFLQIDTSNVLFIVGGAFAGLDQIIAARVGKNSVGFTGDVESARTDETQLFAEAMPEDLLKFGLIPEFIGRLPVLTSVTALDRDGMVAVLTEPKNALVKQYQRLFELDGVALEFEPEAIDAIAEQAMKRNSPRSARDHGRGSAQRHVRRTQQDDVATVVITGGRRGQRPADSGAGAAPSRRRERREKSAWRERLQATAAAGAGAHLASSAA